MIHHEILRGLSLLNLCQLDFYHFLRFLKVDLKSPILLCQIDEKGKVPGKTVLKFFKKLR